MLAVISYRQWERFITAIYQAVAAQSVHAGKPASGDWRGRLQPDGDGAAVV
ncbi:hypothetical protein [Aeromonas salmonicida]